MPYLCHVKKYVMTKKIVNNAEAALRRAWADDLREALRVLNGGGVILYPTDTIWGIGCDACNPEAVRRVYEIKQRADNKALIVLVDSEPKVEFYVRDVPEVAWDLMEVADRPLTLVLDGARNLAPNLLGEDGSIGIRVTAEPFSRDLCMRFKRAIVSTSANVSGAPAPRSFAEIPDAILRAVDYVCTSRREEKQPARASSVIKLTQSGEVSILRP